MRREVRIPMDGKMKYGKSIIGNIQRMIPIACMLPMVLTALTGISYAADESSDTTGGEAIVSGLTVRSQTDGIGPFDDDDSTGNDSSDTNLIVRSFDDIGYTLEYTTALTDATHPITGNVTLNAEFSLPVSPEQARFNEQTLNWMTNKKVTYLYSDGTQSDTWDKSKSVTGQALTGNRILRNSGDDDKVPGAGQLSVGVSVKAASNGEKILPTFKLTASGTDISKTTQPKQVTVSAAPRYNLEMKNNSHTPSNMVYANADNGTVSLTKTDGSPRGRIYGRSVALALWNTSAEKGLKGIELPQGDITYDLKTTATLDDEDSTDNGDWGVSLWDYKENTQSDRGKLGRNMLLFDDSRTKYEAYGAVYNTRSDSDDSDTRDSAYNGGNLSITEDSNDPSILHVTVSKYAFDLDSFTFPKKYAPYDDGEPDIAGNIGYFSAGYFQYLARFPEHVDDMSNFYIETKANNFHVTTLSGDETTTEVKTNDNRIGNVVVVYSKGEFSKMTSYLHNSSYYNAGDDWNRPSAEQKITSRLDYSGSNPIRAIDFLLKFDTNVFDLMPYSASVNPLHPSTAINMEENTKFLYAVKKDGNGWESDDEMLNTRQEQLIYYTSADDLIASGKKCVGILYEARDVYLYAGSDNPEFICSVKISDDAPSGYVAQSVSDARAWTVPNPGTTAATKNADGTVGAVLPSEYGNTKWVDGYSEPEYIDVTPYSKTTYKDGVVSGGHTNGIRGGDSLLIVTAENRVDITVADKASDGSAKDVYDLDANERTVKFNVQPSITWKSNGYVDSIKGGTADVYVTIPKGLTYNDKSCTQDVESVTRNEDGTTTLRITYSDVSFGSKLDSFELTCTIGNAGTTDDVANNEQLQAQARITSSFDNRNATKERGNLSDATIAVIRLAAISILKSVSPQHGNVGCSHTWTMKFGNSSQTTVSNMIVADVMPYVGDGRGTSFTGKYVVKKITINFSDISAISVPTEPLFYSSDSSVTTDDIDNIVKAKAALQFTSLGTPDIIGNTMTFNDVNLTDDLFRALKLDIDKIPGNTYITMNIDVSVTDDNGTLYNDSNGKTQKTGDKYSNSFAEYADGQASIVYSNVVTHNVKMRTISIKKEWKNDDLYGSFYRPESIAATITGSDNIEYSVLLSNSNNWRASKELPYYDDKGDELTYSVKETNVDKNFYIPSVSGNQDDGFTITNSFVYKATGSIDLNGTKTITGRAFEKGDAITFHIEGTVEGVSPKSIPAGNSSSDSQLSAPLPSNVNDAGDLTVNPTFGKSIAIDFGTINVDLQYLHKNLVYTITEKSATGRGLGMDSSKKTVRIFVDDVKKNGKLTLSIVDGSDDISFNDAFTPEKTPTSFTINKQLTGRSWKAGEEFEAVITTKANDTISKQEAADALGRETKTVSIVAPANGDTGTLDIPLTVKKPGTYTYDVMEKNAGKRIDGVSYDGKTITVTAVVTQDESTGKLSSTVSYSGGSGDNSNTLINSYSPDGGTIGGIKVTKNLIGRSWRDSDKFVFRISPSDDATKTAINSGDVALPVDDTVTIGNGNGHAATFGDISVKKPGTYKFDVEEQQHDISGVDIAPKTTVTVRAADDGNGNIKCSFDGESNLAFTDYYGKDSSTSIPLIGKKVLSHDGYDKVPDITGRYSFTLTDSNGIKIAEAKNDKNGKINLGKLDYTMDDMADAKSDKDGQRVKAFRYTISESGNVDGITNDAVQTKNVTVTVTDDGNGNLTATAENTDDNLFTFTNTFTTSCDIPVITGTKTLKNAPDGDNTDYSFRLSAADDSTKKAIDNGSLKISDNGTYQETKCKAGEKFSFKTMTVTKPGTYSFTVSEIVPNDDKKAAGVTYDDTIYTLRYVVSMSNDGSMILKADVKNPESCDFTNVYDAKGIAEIKASKVLDGAELKDGEFEFELNDKDGKTISTAKNDLNGNVAFDGIEYGIDDAGKTYEYTIREIVGNEIGIAYDDMVINVSVDVENAGDGKLTTTVSYDGSSNIGVFHNVYTPPTTIGGTINKAIGDTISELVQTGVEFRHLIGTAISAVAVIAIDKQRRKRRK